MNSVADTSDDLLKECRIIIYRAGHLVSAEVTHLPTGFVERERDSKSQHRAKEACLCRLRQRLANPEEA